MRPTCLVLLVAAALTACVSAHDCATAIPEDLRADTLRFVMDRGLCDTSLMPRDAIALALGAGTPYAELTPERKQQLAMYAAAYASCIRERVDR